MQLELILQFLTISRQNASPRSVMSPPPISLSLCFCLSVCLSVCLSLSLCLAIFLSALFSKQMKQIIHQPISASVRFVILPEAYLVISDAALFEAFSRKGRTVTIQYVRSEKMSFPVCQGCQ
jgi:hypothetical protein